MMFLCFFFALSPTYMVSQFSKEVGDHLLPSHGGAGRWYINFFFANTLSWSAWVVNNPVAICIGTGAL